MARRSLLRLPLARQRAGNRLAAVECYHDVFAAVVGHDHGRNDRPARALPNEVSMIGAPSEERLAPPFRRAERKQDEAETDGYLGNVR